MSDAEPHTVDNRLPRSSKNPESPDSSTTYRGVRDHPEPLGEQTSVTVNGSPLPCRYDLLSASPSGFEWGYGGSGPAQLALSILAHATDEETAIEHYQEFKTDVIAELPDEQWTLTRTEIGDWLDDVDS